MLRHALRDSLVAVLWGSAAYGAAVLYEILSRVGSCLGQVEPDITPQCIVVQTHLTVDARYDLLVALGCAAVGFLAGMVIWPRPMPTRRDRVASVLVPVLVSAGFVVVARLFDPALRDDGHALAAGVLVFLAWMGTRDIGHVWAGLGVDPASHGGYQAPALHRLRLRLLSAIALSIGLAATVERVVSPPDLRHIRVEGVLLATGMCVSAAFLLLLLAQYVAVRVRWADSEMVGGRGIVSRWLAACASLVLLAVSAAVVAPPASATAVDVGRAALAALLGPAPSSAPDRHSCRTDKQYCGKIPKKIVKRTLHRSAVTKRTQRLTLRTKVLGTLVVLMAVGLLVYLWIGRSVPRRRRVMQVLRALWEAVRRARRRAYLLLEPLLPESLAVLTAPTSRGRTRRGATSRRTQIVWYYLDTVRYVGRHGIIRRPSQTPEDFATTAVQRLQDDSDTWATATTTFLAARYSRRDPSEAEVTGMKAAWRQIRRTGRSRTR